MSKNELAEAILRLLEGRGDHRKAAQAVAAYLVAERRTDELNALLRKLEELRYKRGGNLEVTATSARLLSEDTKSKIREVFAAKKTRIHEEINKDIIGGVKVRALDKAADFSVQARLRRLRSGRSL